MQVKENIPIDRMSSVGIFYFFVRPLNLFDQ